MRLSVPKQCLRCGSPILTTEELDRHDLYCEGYGAWHESHLQDQELHKREAGSPLTHPSVTAEPISLPASPSPAEGES